MLVVLQVTPTGRSGHLSKVKPAACLVKHFTYFAGYYSFWGGKNMLIHSVIEKIETTHVMFV